MNLFVCIKLQPFSYNFPFFMWFIPWVDAIGIKPVHGDHESNFKIVCAIPCGCNTPAKWTNKWTKNYMRKIEDKIGIPININVKLNPFYATKYSVTNHTHTWCKLISVFSNTIQYFRWIIIEIILWSVSNSIRKLIFFR